MIDAMKFSMPIFILKSPYKFCKYLRLSYKKGHFCVWRKDKKEESLYDSTKAVPIRL